VFLVINVCNHGEDYETPRIINLPLDAPLWCSASLINSAVFQKKGNKTEI
jgi:hypothetical protein